MGSGSSVARPSAQSGKGTKKAWAEQNNKLTGSWSFLLKEQVQCLCEGSKWCTREDPSKQKSPNAIPGLHSSWVGTDILAMARPWQEHVHKHKLLDAFAEHNIGMILNLQEVGEHANCGPGNLPQSGFSYDPETFMAAKVGFYNFSWRDMGVPDLDLMMDIVQVMHHVTHCERRKIAVHCHAGLGRTGLAIACFFVFAGQYTAAAAVEAVRRDRKGALQTSQQVQFVSVFEQYLQYLRCLFQPTSKLLPTTASAPATPRGNAAQISPAGSGPAAAAESTEPSSGSSPQPEFSSKSMHSVGTQLPWNDKLQMQAIPGPEKFRAPPPTGYDEALRRQQRLLHGPERRALLHMHKFVKEAVFAIISACKRHLSQAASCLPPSNHPPPATTAFQSRPGTTVDYVQASLSTLEKAPPTASFAHALVACIHTRKNSAAHVATMSQLAGQPLYHHFALGYASNSAQGPASQQPSPAAALAASLQHLKHQANNHNYSSLAGMPTAAVAYALEDFLFPFNEGCLSNSGLQHIIAIYQSLQYVVTADPEPQQFAEALKALKPLKVRDAEVLLVFGALLRHSAKAAAAGASGWEVAVLGVAQWISELLLGCHLSRDSDIQEAVMSFLYYLLQNDVAYACLVLMRKQRAEGLSEKSSLQLSALPQATVFDRLRTQSAPPAIIRSLLPPPLPAMAGSTLSPKVERSGNSASFLSSTCLPGQSMSDMDASHVAALVQAYQSAMQSGLTATAASTVVEHVHNTGGIHAVDELATRTSTDLYALALKTQLCGTSTITVQTSSDGAAVVHDVWR